MGGILKLSNISLNYHTPRLETVAIKSISLEVEEGEFISIVGPSGCGKSTLLSIISGLIAPSGGEIAFHHAAGGSQRGNIGYMLQKDHLLPWRSILRNVLLGLEIRNKLDKNSRRRAEELLEKYGLGDFKHHHPAQLSGGMRQRVALIRTLAIDPDILLLDEPFSALDYQTRLSVADDIEAIIKNEKKTAILVTHDISEAISVAKRVVVLSKRPSVVKSVHEIKLTAANRTPMESRKAPEFREYFNRIWKELDVND